MVRVLPGSVLMDSRRATLATRAANVSPVRVHEHDSATARPAIAWSSNEGGSARTRRIDSAKPAASSAGR